jgi:beta-galactosidase/beta-glucuronidase
LAYPTGGTIMKRFPTPFLALQFLCAAGLIAADTSINLTGQWRFALDRDDAGIKERWCERALDHRIQLPGALQNQGFGDAITVDTKWTGDVGSDRWRTEPQYARYR